MIYKALQDCPGLSLSFAMSFILVLSVSGMGDVVEGEANVGDEAQVWMDGLNDSSYRVRRESFLKLCDRSIDIGNWLTQESKNPDKYRASVAQWLIRLRNSSGTTAERIQLLRDLESLRNLDESTLERYVSEGRWESLIELFGLLAPPIRRELLEEGNRTEVIVDKAWQSNNESFVPQLYELSTSPTERVYVNLWWRKLGMPDEWKLTEKDSLVSIEVTRLEAAGKIDDAVKLATKSGLLNLVERLLIRSNSWEQWLDLDSRRIPFRDVGNIHQQKTIVLIMQGKLDEANELLDKTRSSPFKGGFTNGDAAIALALDRNTEFEEYIKTIPQSQAFDAMRLLGNVRGAFLQAGLSDLSIESVRTWLREEGYAKREAKKDLKQRNSTFGQTSKESELLSYSDYFFQLGLNAQGNIVEEAFVKSAEEREAVDGIWAWAPLFKEWQLKNDRKKAIQYWVKFMVRDNSRAAKPISKQLSGDEDGMVSCWRDMYREFPTLAPKLYDYFYSSSVRVEMKNPSLSKEDRILQSTQSAFDSLEDLHYGRTPQVWKNNIPVADLHQRFITNTNQRDLVDEKLVIELADLFEFLGSTDSALDTIALISTSPSVVRAQAKYLTKLGKVDQASDLLVSEFQNNSTDISLFLECTDALEMAGRFSELDRYRIQGLSNVGNNRTDLLDREHSILTLRERPEVRLVFEQLWLRTDSFAAVRCLTKQFSEAALKDPSLTKKSADFARIETLENVKYFWPNESIELSRLMLFFISRSFRPLILEAIEKGDQVMADNLFKVVRRCSQFDIDLPIDVIPYAERAFGKEFGDAWFNSFFEPMKAHLLEFPDDALMGNNTAWFAASLNRELESARALALKVVASDPSPTYLDTLAEIEYRLGNAEAAIRLSERCRALEPRDKHHREQLQRFRAGKP